MTMETKVVNTISEVHIGLGDRNISVPVLVLLLYI